MFFTRFIELFKQSLIFRVKFYLWLAIPLLVFFHFLAISTMLVMYGLPSKELKYLWSNSFSF